VDFFYKYQGFSSLVSNSPVQIAAMNGTLLVVIYSYLNVPLLKNTDESHPILYCLFYNKVKGISSWLGYIFSHHFVLLLSMQDSKDLDPNAVQDLIP